MKSTTAIAPLVLVGLVAGMTSSAGAGQTVSNRIACTQTALLAAITQANANGGGTITFNCSATTIPMTAGLGTIQDGVVLDGEDRRITLEYTANFTGCTSGSGPAIGHLRGRHSTVRNLTFKHFLESLQIIGPDNVVEKNVFLAHSCSDDAISTTTLQSLNATIRLNRAQDYRDKALQLSLGSGTIEGNTFVNAKQPIRGPYDNSQGGVFVIRSNHFMTTGARDACTGVTIDGTYQIVFEENTLECFRGIRLGGNTQAIIRDNLIAGNPRQGVLIQGNAVASLSGNTITNNGLSPGTEPAGGVVVWENGRADLGGGALTLVGQTLTSRGSNRIQGNGVADVRNLRTGYTVKAEGNCWDHQTLSTILSTDRVGDVDVEPFAATCGPTTVTAPQPPTQLRVLK
jgi:parallel beta-helix repeat protein